MAFCGRFPWWLSGKESACRAADLGSIPGLGRSPGGGHGNPLSTLENFLERSLVNYSPWGRTGLDTTEVAKLQQQWPSAPQFRLSCVRLCATPWAVTPLSMGFSRQELVAISYSRGSSPPGDRTCFLCFLIGRRILYHPGSPSCRYDFSYFPLSH